MAGNSFNDILGITRFRQGNDANHGNRRMMFAPDNFAVAILAQEVRKKKVGICPLSMQEVQSSNVHGAR